MLRILQDVQLLPLQLAIRQNFQLFCKGIVQPGLPFDWRADQTDFDGRQDEEGSVDVALYP